ncbi:hypothetical protein KORDIASMS9_03694 [Kordia sp. SMS9]|uniref:T9SS type A sorting domain-containing protein n=1 Tax=Kordia sp. SMS9 TaxID=2282170 RepID=UPI000E0DFFF8|nr:T9SS type A sorting domain-containing protein [Kordia sp. SMS9]AXG71437.1 hypothetical protein KORDIASMS9_03694 [Kordia sp. SMS9]
MKTKLLLLKLFLTLSVTAQQVYYTIPGANGNNGQVRDIITSGSTLYVSVGAYSNTGTFPLRKAILSLNTTQSSVSAQEVFIGSSPGVANLALNQNILRVNGGLSNIDFYDIDLNQALPTTPTIVSGLPVTGIHNHVFYQNNFIYASNIGNSTTLELFLPLQTLNIPSVLWDAEVLNDTLYYTTSDNTNLYAIDLTSATATPQIVHTDIDEIVAIEVSANYIHYGTFQGAKIKRLNRTTNAVTTLATIPPSGNTFVDFPRAVEVIGNQVFYAPGAGELYAIVDNTLSINDFDTTKLTVFPNPVIDQLHVTADTTIKSFSIFSVLGKEIMIGDSPTTIDVSQLKSGMYFIKINSEKGSITKQFIKK